MADEAKIGTIWQADDLDLIVADLFRHARSRSRRPALCEVQAQPGVDGPNWTHPPFDQIQTPKHLGRGGSAGHAVDSWLHTKRNYQNAIFDAIDRYLSRHEEILESVPIAPASAKPPSEVFVPEPPLITTHKPIPERLRRLVRKFDPVERDHRNRSLGKAGEEFVVDLERRRLTEADRSDLARRIRWVSAEDGDGAGYDVLSFEPTGRERLLEVKTTNGSAHTPFFLSRNECDLAMERPEDWRIYRVHLFCKQPRVFTIAPPLDNVVYLRPESWRASFTRAREIDRGAAEGNSRLSSDRHA